MYQVIRCLVLAALLSLQAAADVTIRSHEGGTRAGKQWGETYTEYHSEAGLRVDVTTDGAAAPYMSFLFLKNPDRLFIVQGSSVTGVDRGQLEQLESRAGIKTAPQTAAAPIGTRHSFNGFLCEGYRVKRAGKPVRYLCLATPESLGLSADVVANAASMRDMLSRLMAVSQSGRGQTAEAFNPFRVGARYPVRMWESSAGEITWESQVLSIAQGPISPEVFRAPSRRD